MRGDEVASADAGHLNNDSGISVSGSKPLKDSSKPAPTESERNGVSSPTLEAPDAVELVAGPVVSEEPLAQVTAVANRIQVDAVNEHTSKLNGHNHITNGHATESVQADAYTSDHTPERHRTEPRENGPTGPDIMSIAPVTTGGDDSTNGATIESVIQDREKSSIPDVKHDPTTPAASAGSAPDAFSTNLETTPRPPAVPRNFIHQPTLPPPNLRPQSMLFDPDDASSYDAEAVAEAASGRSRPQSILTEPLTHPNGVSMFPHLTTQEQDALAWEAAGQVESVIDPDSDEASLVGGSSTATATEGGQGTAGADTDSDDGRSDAGYASDARSSASTSVESTVRDFMFENGRRYHRYREGRYNFPNDEVEQEREDMKHAMVKLLCSQKLHFAPIGPYPQQVLDIGTGTGIWAIEMADKYPSANILGIDLSPIQPDWVPPNVRFMVDDIESAWLYPRNHFDYIHSRHTVMAIKDWMRLFRRAYEHIKPGGWIELQEIHHSPVSADNSMPPEHPVARYWDLITEGLGALGVNFHAAAGGHLANMAREAGFVNVTERVLHVPIGTWPRNKVLKQVGVYWRTILMDGIQAIALGPLTRGLRWTREQVEVFLVDVRRAYFDVGALMYMRMHIIYGQKPLDAY